MRTLSGAFCAQRSAQAKKIAKVKAHVDCFVCADDLDRIFCNSGADEAAKAALRAIPGDLTEAARKTFATNKVRILITASIRKGTCIKRQKRTTDKGCACFFFIRRRLEVKARGCRGKNSACLFPVSAPPCGAFSNAPTSGFQANGLIYRPLFRAFAKHSYAPAATVRRLPP